MTTTPRATPRPWLEADCNVLRTHYATGDLQALTTQLGRSITQLMAKANHLGLARDPDTVLKLRTSRPDTQSIRDALLELGSSPTGTRVEAVAAALGFRQGRVDSVAQNMCRAGRLFKARISHRKTLYFTDRKLACAANKFNPGSARPKPGRAAAATPTVTIARSTRGPAYLPGEPLITPATRWTIAPPPPARTLRTNTHMFSG